LSSTISLEAVRGTSFVGREADSQQPSGRSRRHGLDGPWAKQGESAPMKIQSLEDLLADQLKDLYSAENQLVKALPKMAKAATAPDLRRGFEEHLEQIRGAPRFVERRGPDLIHRNLISEILHFLLDSPIRDRDNLFIPLTARPRSGEGRDLSTPFNRFPILFLIFTKELGPCHVCSSPVRDAASR
jgi:hypothetical protein